jgi:hypothetical protein
MTDLRPEALLALADLIDRDPMKYIGQAAATLRALAAQPQRCAELEQLLKVMERQYADALERIQKMQPEAWIELAGSVVPLYRFPIGEDK